MFRIRDLVKFTIFQVAKPNRYGIREKQMIDKSKVPEICEKDLEEHFIKGSGPGGQCINKRSNCIYLLHKPTGISVKCQFDRDRERNRKIAREKLVTKLDNLYNGEDSIENQKKSILIKKSRDKIRKRLKRIQQKEECLAIANQANDEFCKD